MSAVAVYQGLEERFKTVEGIKIFALGEPTAIHDAPELYTVGLRFERTLRNLPPSQSTVSGTHYFMAHRLVFRFQDNAMAEMEVLAYIDAMLNAIDADPRLGGRLSNRLMAKIISADVGFSEISSTLYRVVDFTSETVYKV